MKKYIIAGLFTFSQLLAIEPSDKNKLMEIEEKLNDKSLQELYGTATAIGKRIPIQAHQMELVSNVIIEGDNKILISGFLDKRFLEKQTTMNMSAEDIFYARNKYLFSLNEVNRRYLCSRPETYAIMEKGFIFSNQYRLDDFALFGIVETSLDDCSEKRMNEDIPQSLYGAGRYPFNAKERMLQKRKK